MGEGAAMFVLESAERARRRGARVYAEVAGFGATSDAFHMIIPSSDPAPAAAAMQAALDDAGIEPRARSITSTPTPPARPSATKAKPAPCTPCSASTLASVPVSSTKSMTGHLLSAAAAVEALACLVAIERQQIPPTINLDEPDPECDLCHVPHQAIAQPVNVALSNSFGFGGSNTTLVAAARRPSSCNPDRTAAQRLRQTALDSATAAVLSRPLIYPLLARFVRLPAG